MDHVVGDGETPQLHRSLTRQLKRLGLQLDSPPDRSAWIKLLDKVSASYTDADADRYTLERSIDVSSEEMRALHAELSAQARHDPLTGLPNRAALMEQLSVALAGARRLGHDVAILFIDLDGFKAVNDSLGHAAGDDLLIRASERIRGVIRESDVLARLGGDEFVVLGVNKPEEASRITGAAQRIVATLENAFRLGAQDVYVSASVGVAWANAGDASADELLRRADLAMYQAKARGRSQFVIFDEAMLASSEDRVLMEAALRRALAEQQFVLHYQPIFRLSDDAIVGVEALVRWRRADGELVPPGAFLPVAETSRLMTGIGAWIVGEACRQVGVWNRQNVLSSGHHVPYVSVNVSPRELMHEDIVGAVTGALQRSQLHPNQLVLEITESTLQNPCDLSLQNLTRLRALGVRVALDHFGTGHVALSSLRRLPAEVLKIDRSLVADVDEDPETAAIIGAVIAMAHALGLSVVAQGVERASQAERLAALGCDAAQGFELACPMDGVDLCNLLRAADAA